MSTQTDLQHIVSAHARTINEAFSVVHVKDNAGSGVTLYFDGPDTAQPVADAINAAIKAPAEVGC